MEELVAIAKIVKSRGLKGELVAELLTDFPERFEQLTDVVAVDQNDARRNLKIEKFWFQNDRVILKFNGFDSIEAAEVLRDSDICVTESEAVDLGEDEYFDWELEGCRVETLDGTNVGVVSGLMRNGGTEILIVKDGDKDHLIPFASTICPEVDIDGKLIRIDPPDGLLEF
ncbi:MAG: 16S rRNA processing protein RimM [Pyrinomonadaceae bacterium]|nr:16S rRNA processing protein RimM [Pyrinomonadaceae bacterium]